MHFYCTLLYNNSETFNKKRKNNNLKKKQVFGTPKKFQT